MEVNGFARSYRFLVSCNPFRGILWCRASPPGPADEEEPQAPGEKEADMQLCTAGPMQVYLRQHAVPPAQEDKAEALVDGRGCAPESDPGFLLPGRAWVPDSMSYVLTTLNAKYTHSSLALRYIAAYARRYGGVDPLVLEFSINQPYMQVFDSILLCKPTVVGFSTYIWNIDMTLRIARMLKRVLPSTLVLLGGPEVSFDAEDLLSSIGEVDVVIRGEGEETMAEVLDHVRRAQASGLHSPSDIIHLLQAVRGLSLRGADGVPRSTADRPPISYLGRIPNPYAGGYDSLSGKIIYYESSRGCPFSCGYCLSSTTDGVRFFPMERVLTDIGDMVRERVLQVKFVDRTFNCHGERARQVWRHAMALSPQAPPYPTTFHFEIGADLLTEEDLDLLDGAPPGLFQFEVGVQTTNPPSLLAVNREMSVDKLGRAVTRLVEAGRVRVNLDLISGLPFDTHETFSKSIDYALGLRPHAVHIGLLKALKGSRIRREVDSLGLVHSPNAPHEVLMTSECGATQLAAVRGVAEMVDLFYNSRKFEACLNLCLAAWDRPSTFFAELAERSAVQGTAGVSHSLDWLYGMLQQFIDGSRPGLAPALADLIRFDRLRLGLPTPGSHVAERSLAQALIPRLADLSAREMSKRAAVAEFSWDVIAMHGLSDRGSILRELNKPRAVRVLVAYADRGMGEDVSTVVECPVPDRREL